MPLVHWLISVICRVSRFSVMATANSTMDFEDFITCGVCLCEYDDLNRKPKFLLCTARHTVCLPCLRKIIRNTTVSCPFCRESFYSADVANLPNNSYVLHMLKFREQKVSKPAAINGQFINPLGTSSCPTCGSEIKSAGINNLAIAIEKRKEAKNQLSVAIKSIQAAEEEVKKIQEENDLKFAEMVSVLELQTKTIPKTIPASVPIGNFVLRDDSVFILRLFQSGQQKGEVHIRPYISRATKHFQKKLGEFCYKSPKNFNTAVDKAWSSALVLLSMEDQQFQPVTTDITNFSVEKANDYGEVGITAINVSPNWNNQVTGWSFVFILEYSETFVERENLPVHVSNSEFFGTVLNHQMMQTLIQLSRVSRAERPSYTFTLESR